MWIIQHMSKTGGMSLKNALYETYKPEEILETTTFPNRHTPEVVEGWTEKTKMVRGHLLFGIHRFFDGVQGYITILRDPLARVVSHFAWHERHTYVQHNIDLWNSGRVYRDFDDFIDDPAFTQSHNLMTRKVAGLLGPESTGLKLKWAPCSRDLLETAKRNIDQWYPFVGALECLDMSVKRIGMLLGRELPHLGHHNKMTNPVKPTPNQIRRIEANNSLDYELYEYCRDKFGWE